MRWTERRMWKRAQSLDDLGELTVKWLNGEIEETPGHLGPPDCETADIRHSLKGFNRNGFVTTQSQPGEEDSNEEGGRWSQRAFVEGYCHPDTADRIMAAVEKARCDHDEHQGRAALVAYRQPVSDMPGRCACVWHWMAGREKDPVEPVTMVGNDEDGMHVHTACPGKIDRSDHDMTWFKPVGEHAWLDLEHSDRVTVVDTHWGASRILWEVVGDELAWPGSRSQER